MRKMMIGLAFFAILGVAAYLRFHHPQGPREVAYAANRQVTLWSTTAQVREPVATVSFGDRLDVLDRFQDEVEVRTPRGTRGWVNQRELLSAELWEKAGDLDRKAATMPVEARGHTRVLVNLHVEPGRDAPRVRQLNKDVAVDLLAREPVQPQTANRASPDEESPVSSASGTPPGDKTQAKKEDWWLILARTPDQGAIAGWMLGRFIDLDVPAPLPDYASSAAMRIVGWFELNDVKDLAGNAKPQYLVVGAKGPEGQVCDFSLLRVYTWAVKRDRYETAFVEGGVCGKLPVDLSRATAPGNAITFSFEDLSAGAPEKRTYRMQQTIVRRVKQGASAKPGKHARSSLSRRGVFSCAGVAARQSP
jgi:hypothetical protein